MAEKIGSVILPSSIDGTLKFSWMECAPVLESAARSIGVLNSRLHGRSLLRDAWLFRERLMAAEKWSAVDRGALATGELLGLLANLPVARKKDYGALSYSYSVAAEMLRKFPQNKSVLSRKDLQFIGLEGADELNLDDSFSEITAMMRKFQKEYPSLIAAGMGAYCWLSDNRDPALARFAVSDFLHRTGFTSIPLPSLTGCGALPYDKGFKAWLPSFLKDLDRSANEGDERLRLLWVEWSRWHDAIGDRRSTSFMPRIVNIMAALPSVCSSSLAKILKTERSTCSRALKELEALGVISELSGRKTWKAYVTRDMTSVLLDALQRRGELNEGQVKYASNSSSDIEDAPAQDETSRKEGTQVDWDMDLSALFREADEALKKASSAVMQFKRS